MGVVTVSAAYGAAGAEVSPGGGRAARAAVPRPGDPGSGRRPARVCRCRRPRRTTRPSCAGCGGWSPRWAPCPTPWAGCCRRRRCPTRGPTGSRPSGCWRRSPTGPGAWCSAGPARSCWAIGRTRCTSGSTGRGSGDWRRRSRARARPAEEVRPRDGGQRPDAGGLRAALLPLRPGGRAALSPGGGHDGAAGRDGRRARGDGGARAGDRSALTAAAGAWHAAHCAASLALSLPPLSTSRSTCPQICFRWSAGRIGARSNT